MAQAIARHSRALNLGRSPRPAPPPEPTIADQRERADAALVAADDALLASAEELAALADPDLPDGLRTTEETAAPFVAALAAAQADVDTACDLRIRAADEPDQEAEAGLLEQVEQMCRSASSRLDEQSRAFDALRNLDRVVATILAALTAKMPVLHERLADSAQIGADLATRFPSIALATVREDIGQASDRAAFAEDSLSVAAELLRTGDRRGAIARCRAAEAALRQASLLLDELAHLPDELARATAGIQVLLDQTRRDLAQAGSLAQLAPSAPAIRFTTATVEWASGAVASGRIDPVATRRALMESDSALVQALGDTLDPGVARERAEALADCCAEAAGASLRSASTAITTRRAVVGAEARLRLAAARRLAAGTSQEEPVSRIKHLQEADRLADQALALAHRDEARAHDRVVAAAGPVTHQLASAVVGGILVRPSVTRGEAEDEPRTTPGDPAAAVRFLGQMAAVSFGGRATRARRGNAGRF